MLERSGAPEPRFLPHIMLRARDVMQREFPAMEDGTPIREAGMAMAAAGLDVVPLVDGEGALTGVVTERALARRFIRESRQTSTLEETHFSDEEVKRLEKSLLWKLDTRMLPMLAILFLFSFLDRYVSSICPRPLKAD